MLISLMNLRFSVKNNVHLSNITVMEFYLFSVHISYSLKKISKRDQNAQLTLNKVLKLHFVRRWE